MSILFGVEVYLINPLERVYTCNAFDGVHDDTRGPRTAPRRSLQWTSFVIGPILHPLLGVWIATIISKG